MSSSPASTGLPPSAGFFLGGGGGGGFFLPSSPAALLIVLRCDCAGEGVLPASAALLPPPLALPRYPPTLPDTPYFWSRLFAFLAPAATCSPCLSRKLFAVEAADFASENETELGFFLKSDIVFRAACFSAHVVPWAGAAAWAGGGGGVELLPKPPNFENRDCSSFTVPDPPAAGGGAGLLAPDREGGGGGKTPLLPPPMPSPGTETPEAPSRSTAPWFRNPVCRLGAAGAGSPGEAPGEGPGDALLFRGGSRGGKLGGGGFAAAEYGGGGGLAAGSLPSAPSLRPGGGGR